jgi:DnaJ-class molecular chaperone
MGTLDKQKQGQECAELKECPICEGKGKRGDDTTCPRCKGTGKVPRN